MFKNIEGENLLDKTIEDIDINKDQIISEEKTLMEKFSGKSKDVAKMMVLITTLTMGSGAFEKAYSQEEKPSTQKTTIEVDQANIDKKKIPGGRIISTQFEGTISGNIDKYDEIAFTDNGKDELMKVFQNKNRSTAKIVFGAIQRRFIVRYQAFLNGDISKEDYRTILEFDNNRFLKMGAENSIYDVDKILNQKK